MVASWAGVTAVADWARATLPQAKAIERDRRLREMRCECTIVVDSFERERETGNVLAEKSGVLLVVGGGG
jgi:hypothetical protein